MSKMIDCYSPLTQSQLAALKAAGITQVGRYLGAKTHGWDKGMTPTEVKLIQQAGMTIVSVWEGNPTHASYFTYQQGLKDAHDAVTDAQWLGQPEGTAIYFAVDYDCQDADIPAILNYFNGVKAGIGNYKYGVYGGYRALSNVDADYYWQTCAWNYGQSSPRRCIYQCQVDTKLSGVSVDINEVYKECGAWPKPMPNLEVKPPVRQPVQAQPQPQSQAQPQPVNYPTYDVVVVDHPYKAIAVNNSTYVLWTALNEFGKRNIVNKGNGLLNVDGKDIQGVVYNGDTYVPWSGLVDGVQAHKVQWYFNK